MGSSNTCPLAAGCRDWQRYQRNTLLAGLVDTTPSYGLVLMLLEMAGKGAPPPIGYEFQYRIAREIVRLDVKLPTTKAGLSLAVKSAVNG